MVHRHAFGPIWIERGMCEPTKNGSGPAQQVQIRQLIPIDRFKGFQNRTNFFLSMSGHHAKGALGIQTATKLPPKDVRSREDFFKRNDLPTVRSDQAEGYLPLVGWGG